MLRTFGVSKHVCHRQITRRLSSIQDNSSWLSDFGIIEIAVNPKAPKPYADRLALFEDWLRNAGARFPNLELRESTSSGATRGQGCAGYARVGIPAKTPVIELPMHCLLSAPALRQSLLGEVAIESGVDENEGNLFLVLELLRLWSLQQQQQGGNRVNSCDIFFGPYLDILPRRLPHVPVFWPEKELTTLLQGSPLVAAVKARQEAILRDFNLLKATAAKFRAQGPTRGCGSGGSDAGDSSGRASAEHALAVLLDEATPADFAVAEMTVCSRAFRVPGAGKGGRAAHCLVPLADMLNTALPHTCDVDFNTRSVPHDVLVASLKGPESSGRNHGGVNGGGGGGKQEFVMTTVAALKAGQQVHDSYGYKGNERYLMNYGFSLDANTRHDGSCPNEVTLALACPVSLAFAEEKNGAISGSNPRDQKARVWAAVAAGAEGASMRQQKQRHNTGSLGDCLEVPVSLVTPPDPTTVPSRWPVLSLLRFLVASEEEIARLCSAHLRGLPGTAAAQTTAGQGTDLGGASRGGSGGDPAQGSEEAESKAAAALNSSPLSHRRLFGEQSSSPSSLPRDEFDEFEDDDDDDDDDCDDDDDEHDQLGLRQEEVAVDLKFAWARLCSVPRVSRDNEARAWGLLADLTKSALEAYREEDQIGLAGAGGEPFERFSNAWNAAVQIRGEIEVLRHWHAFALLRVESSPDTSAMSAMQAALEYKRRSPAGATKS